MGLSKFAIDTSCKEFAHPWIDSCIRGSIDHGLHAVKESLKLYSAFYFFTLLMKRKVPSKKDMKKTVFGIIRSTLYLSTMFFMFGVFLCNIRRLLGSFNIFTVAFIPAFLSTFLAILIEKSSRRAMLTLYVTNAGTEALFRMAVSRGYISPLPRAEVYMFAASVATLMYFYRSKTNNKDSIFDIIRFVLGEHEETKHMKRRENHPPTSLCKDHENTCNCRKKSRNRNSGISQKSIDICKLVINKLKAQATMSKHEICPHPHGCLRYILASSVKMFGYGVAAQLLLKTVFQVKNILREPNHLRKIFLNRDNYELASFVGGFTGLYKLASCLLRRAFDNDSPYFAVPASLFASLAFVKYPSNTFALSVFWKTLHLLWNNGVKSKILPKSKWFVVFLFSFMVAVMTHVIMIEPQHIRASFLKFYVTLTGGRILLMSRVPLDKFGFDSSKSLQEVLQRMNFAK